MRVKMTTSRSWPDADGRTVSVSDGDEVEIADNDEARRLLESGQATPVASKPSDRAERRGPGRPRKEHA